MVKYVLKYKSVENPDSWNIADEYSSSEFIDAKKDCEEWLSIPNITAARIVCVTIDISRTEFGRYEKDNEKIAKSGMFAI